MTNNLVKLTELIVFPFVGVVVILISAKFLWKPTQPRVAEDVQHISSKDTIGWMCIGHFITVMLLFFIVLWSRVDGIGKPLMLLFTVVLVINVIIAFKSKYAMVALSKDRLLIRGIFCKAAISLTDIESISQDFIKVSTPRIRIFFKHNTSFGKSVIFIPVNEQVEHDLRSLLNRQED